jgi:arylsulfatase A-like enzyme
MCGCVRFCVGLVISMALAGGSLVAEQPNILLIYSDDHGWADLGLQGVDPDIRTPHLDQLVRDGVRFARGYVSAPQCVPSRAGVITGRYQQRFGVEDNLKGPLPARELTLAERLKAAGYLTGMSGKWHLDIGGEKGGPKAARLQPDSMPHRQGFDEYWRGELLQYYASHDLAGVPLIDPPKIVNDPRFRVVVQTEAALSFLERRSSQPEQPWFFYLAWYAPHVPLDSPEPWFSATPSHLPLERRQALAMIAAMDDGLGRIREKLRAMNQQDKTLIVFIGDNGAPLKEGAWDGSVNAPMVGEKGMLTDGGIRVPFVAAWPGQIPAGTVYEHPVINLDVAATAVAAAGLPPDPLLDGVDLLPHLRGEIATPPHDSLYWRWRSQAAILEFPWKLIWLGDHRRYLFDLRDPKAESSERNLIDQQPAIVERLEAKWKAWSQGLQPAGGPEAENVQDNLFFSAHVEHTGTVRKDRAKAGKKPAGDRQSSWICRNGELVEREEGMTVTAQGERTPFLALAPLDVPLPAEVQLQIQSSAPGTAAITWRRAGDADFLPENRVEFTIASSEWEAYTVKLPPGGRLIHLRLALPGKLTSIRQFAIRQPGDEAAAPSK